MAAATTKVRAKGELPLPVLHLARHLAATRAALACAQHCSREAAPRTRELPTWGRLTRAQRPTHQVTSLSLRHFPATNEHRSAMC